MPERFSRWFLLGVIFLVSFCSYHVFSSPTKKSEIPEAKKVSTFDYGGFISYQEGVLQSYGNSLCLIEDEISRDRLQQKILESEKKLVNLQRDLTHDHDLGIMTREGFFARIEKIVSTNYTETHSAVNSDNSNNYRRCWHKPH